MRLTSLALLLFCVSPLAVASGEAPLLDCPHGTEQRSSTGATPPVTRIEVCTDPKTNLNEGPTREWHPNGQLAAEGTLLHGKKHGLSHIYDDTGALLVEVEFSEDQPKHSRMTIAGMNLMARELNERTRQRDKGQEVSVVDEHTMRYDVRVKDSEPRASAELKSGFDVVMACVLFRMPNDNLTGVQLRHLSDAGQVRDETLITREDCRQ